MHPVHRFVARHSLFIGPGIGFVLAAWVLSRLAAPWPAWAALIAFMAAVWTVPVWRRQKATGIRSPEELQSRLRAGRISLVHFYSDF
ncbi:MAG: hypothetical protein ACRD88_22400 [Terriglobia bacterium]